MFVGFCAVSAQSDKLFVLSQTGSKSFNHRGSHFCFSYSTCPESSRQVSMATFGQSLKGTGLSSIFSSHVFVLRVLFLQSLKNIKSSLQARAAQVTSMCPVDSHAGIFIMEKSVTTVLIFGKLNFFKLCYSKVLCYSKYFMFRQIL